MFEPSSTRAAGILSSFRGTLSPRSPAAGVEKVGIDGAAFTVAAGILTNVKLASFSPHANTNGSHRDHHLGKQQPRELKSVQLQEQQRDKKQATSVPGVKEDISDSDDDDCGPTESELRAAHSSPSSGMHESNSDAFEEEFPLSSPLTLESLLRCEENTTASQKGAVVKGLPENGPKKKVHRLVSPHIASSQSNDNKQSEAKTILQIWDEDSDSSNDDAEAPSNSRLGSKTACKASVRRTRSPMVLKRDEAPDVNFTQTRNLETSSLRSRDGRQRLNDIGGYDSGGERSPAIKRKAIIFLSHKDRFGFRPRVSSPLVPRPIEGSAAVLLLGPVAVRCLLHVFTF